MNKKKITYGWVTQEFDDKGNCVSQEFFAGDQVEWEDEDGEEVCVEDYYFPFDMVQPETKEGE